MAEYSIAAFKLLQWNWMQQPISSLLADLSKDWLLIYCLTHRWADCFPVNTLFLPFRTFDSSSSNCWWWWWWIWLSLRKWVCKLLPPLTLLYQIWHNQTQWLLVHLSLFFPATACVYVLLICDRHLFSAEGQHRFPAFIAFFCFQSQLKHQRATLAEIETL